MAHRPRCLRVGCPKTVNKAEAKYCSPECNRQDKAREKPEAVATDAVDVAGDSCVITKQVADEVRTLAQLIEVCGIDTNEWTVDRYLCGKWAEFYQVKAWLKRKAAVVAAQSEIAALVAQAKAEIGIVPQPVVYAAPGAALLEIAIPDLHAGKLAWGKETGHAPYDTKIAERSFDAALEALIQRTSSHAISEVLFVVGNDLLHTDNVAQLTTGGTPQDADGRYHKTFGMVRRMIIRGIERLKQVAPVHVVMVSGNHDSLAVWHLGDSLECYYHTDSQVKIDNAPTQRKYVQHGKVMLLFTHGHKGKPNDYPLVMATEQPKMFGATTFREAHTGHLHKTKLDEFHGVKVRISPALCSPDAWHSENQYVGNGRSAEAFVWHPEEGLIASAFYTVPLAA